MRTRVVGQEKERKNNSPILAIFLLVGRCTLVDIPKKVVLMVIFNSDLFTTKSRRCGGWVLGRLSRSDRKIQQQNFSRFSENLIIVMMTTREWKTWKEPRSRLNFTRSEAKLKWKTSLLSQIVGRNSRSDSSRHENQAELESLRIARTGIKSGWWGWRIRRRGCYTRSNMNWGHDSITGSIIFCWWPVNGTRIRRRRDHHNLMTLSAWS